MQRIPTQNQQATTRWHQQEHSCRSLLPSHGNNDGLVPTTSPEGTQPRSVPVQWPRTILSLAPVRGLTRTSIPPPFHWSQEKCSQTFGRAMDLPKIHGFFSFFYDPGSVVDCVTINLVFLFRCSSSTTNPVCARRVDSSYLLFSRSLHRYSYISLLLYSLVPRQKIKWNIGSTTSKASLKKQKVKELQTNDQE
jgi:hypothetical protein